MSIEERNRHSLLIDRWEQEFPELAADNFDSVLDEYRAYWNLRMREAELTCT